MATALLFLFLTQTGPTCLLTEGVGANFGKIGITRKDNVGVLPDGVVFEYEDSVLIRIYAYGSECQSSKGTKIGDSQEQVQKVYGKGKKTTIYLNKGSHDRVGKLGDFALEYPGVVFVISNSKVAAMFIIAENSQKK